LPGSSSRGWKVTAALLATVLLAGAGAAGFFLLRGEKEQDTERSGWPGAESPPLVRETPPDLGDAFNLLVVVLGQEGSGKEIRTVADTVVLVRVDLRLKRAACLFLPRTTYLEIAGMGKLTLAELWAPGGLALTTAALQDVTGMLIDHHLVLRQDQLARLVDLYGEIDFTLPEAVNDPRRGSLEPGAVQLDGSGVVLVSTYGGYAGGEIGRIGIERSLLVSAAAQLHRAASRPAFAWTVNLSAAEMDTDLATDQLLRLARGFASWPVADLSVGTAPGESGTIGGRKKVFLLDETGLRNAVSSMLAAATVPVP